VAVEAAVAGKLSMEAGAVKLAFQARLPTVPQAAP
jgi:hypothetical protein